jgi:hypothetical protein
MSDPVLIESSPDRPDLFLDLRKRPRDATEIVTDVLLDLRVHMQDPAKGTFPKTIIWTRSLNDMSKFRKLARRTLGKFEYYPAADPPYGRQKHFSNQAVCLFWSDHDVGIKDHVLKQLLDPAGPSCSSSLQPHSLRGSMLRRSCAQSTLACRRNSCTYTNRSAALVEGWTGCRSPLSTRTAVM